MAEIRRRTAWRLVAVAVVVALAWVMGAGVPASAQTVPDPRVITEQNLFHPSRTIPAPPKPVPLKPTAVATPAPPKPQPKFELSGVVMDGGAVVLALLAEPQLTQGKVRVLGPGEMVGSYRVVSIAPDHAILAEPGEPALRVPLMGPKRPAAPLGASAAAPVQIGQTPPGAPGLFLSPQGNAPQRRPQLRPQPPAEEGSGGGEGQQGQQGNGGNRGQPLPDTSGQQAVTESPPPVSETGQPIYRPAWEGPSTPGPRPPAFDPEDFKRQIQQHLKGVPSR